jgi:2-methylisocitrate lyase-like PEP mutase family enzyme
VGIGIGQSYRPGHRLRERLNEDTTLACIGVYDVFSAGIAARTFDALFVSGFSFAASFYGLPDEGFIAWSDLHAFVQRLRVTAPRHHIVVDMDDGYGDDRVASHVTRLLEAVGASAVVLEDQRRPRRCGHLDGKLLLSAEEYRRRLDAVLDARRDMVVVARTDASTPEEINRRVWSSVEAGADAVLVDGASDLDFLARLADSLPVPLVFNQLAGGKSPIVSLKDLDALGVSMALYSTVCLFAAQQSLSEALVELKAGDGRLDGVSRSVDLASCQPVLAGNLAVAFGEDSSAHGWVEPR